MYQRVRFKWQARALEAVSFLGSEEDWSKYRFTNLVIIGGPDHNIKTRQILLDIHRRLSPESRDAICHLISFWKGRSYNPDTFSPTYTKQFPRLLQKDSFAHNYNDAVFTNRRETKSFAPTIGTGHDLEKDYGIAIKCINPYIPDKRVVIVYGAYDYGTKGAMDYITNNNKLRELLEKTHSDNNLWVLVETTVDKRRFVESQKADHSVLHFLSQQRWPKEDSFKSAQCPQKEPTE